MRGKVDFTKWGGGKLSGGGGVDFTKWEGGALGHRVFADNLPPPPPPPYYNPENSLFVQWKGLLYFVREELIYQLTF